MRSALTEDEQRESEERGGGLDWRLFHELAICNYLITDDRPARRECSCRTPENSQ